MKSISPWSQNEVCPLEGFQEFKSALSSASYHNAGPVDEWGQAKSYVVVAAEIAIAQDWPYWAMERMFRDVAPLVSWDSFMQNYINVLKKN